MKRPFIQYLRILGAFAGFHLSVTNYDTLNLYSFFWAALASSFLWSILNDLIPKNYN